MNHYRFGSMSVRHLYDKLMLALRQQKVKIKTPIP